MPTLREQLMSYVDVADEEHSKVFFKTSGHPYYAETLVGEDSPTGRPTVYINDKRFRSEGASKDYRDKVALGEALHLLKEVDPDRYERLYDAAMSSADYRDWANQSYEHMRKNEGERRSFDDWHKTSRFDQVIGGYLFAQDPAYPSLRNWSREDLPFGEPLRRELQVLMKDLGIE